MKRLLASVSLAAVVFSLAPMRPASAIQVTRIELQNKTGAGVWITWYRRTVKDHIATAYCLRPWETKRVGNPSTGVPGLDAYKFVAEFKSETNCRGSTVRRVGQDVSKSTGVYTFEVRNGNFAIRFTPS